jgi:hypothetical protein
MRNCWRSGGTEVVAYSHRYTFQSDPIRRYSFACANILPDTHTRDTEQLLGDRNTSIRTIYQTVGRTLFKDG